MLTLTGCRLDSLFLLSQVLTLGSIPPRVRTMLHLNCYLALLEHEVWDQATSCNLIE